MDTLTPAARVERVRRHATEAIQHGTDLIADLQAFAGAFADLVPELAQATEGERWTEVVRLTGLDAASPDDLATLVETLADVLAGLTSDDSGAAWLAHQRARLAAGEDAAAA
jgi:hypothetical protein